MPKPFTLLYYHFMIITQFTEVAFDVIFYQKWKNLWKHKPTPTNVVKLKTGLDLVWWVLNYNWGGTDTTFLRNE